METFKFNNFIYQHSKTSQGNAHNIVHKQNSPEYLYKFYSLSEKSVKCLTQNYLYAPHPIELNDVLDGNSFLLTASEPLKFEIYRSFFSVWLNDEELKKFYEKDIKNNSRQFLDLYWQYYSNKLGVISLTSEEDNPLMWPHYTNESGFLLKFETEKLSKNIIQKLPGTYFGLYPMNYCKELIQFDVKNTNSPFIPILYLATVKLDFWKYEKEWRFIVSNDNMGVPLNKLGMDFRNGLPTLNESRNIYYNKEVINEITFGSRFITAQNFKIEPITVNGNVTNNIRIAILEKDKEKFRFLSELLEYCCENLKDKIFFSSYDIKLNHKNDKYIKRSKVKVKLEKVGNNLYTLEKIS